MGDRVTENDSSHEEAGHRTELHSALHTRSIAACDWRWLLLELTSSTARRKRAKKRKRHISVQRRELQQDLERKGSSVAPPRAASLAKLFLQQPAAPLGNLAGHLRAAGS
jgi:hypothetical protein